MKNILLISIFAIVVFACTKPDNKTEREMIPTGDIHTYARPDEAKMTHLDLSLNIDFDAKVINGIARITFEADEDAETLILDTKALQIVAVRYDNGSNALFALGNEDVEMGRPLRIDISDGQRVVQVYYKTSPEAGALQWLHPVQTADQEAPFLFTQSQAILARTWIPLQDSPGVRFTYQANVKVPEGLMALMSASNPQKVNDSGEYEFVMDQPIPAYLMALVVGDLSFESLGERTGVYAESSILDDAAYEFGEVEQMLKIAEEMYGPYRWDRYDIIVLPPSFPFGGMENPRLTFATPTIIAGDRSLTSLIAHELAHSWSGNLVTNATWSDFWINEGFTVYFEYRIMEELEGRSYSEMLASLSHQDLKKEVNSMMEENRAEDTKLKLDLRGRNPDDGVTSIAYDKGYFFLRYLEEMVGRDLFDQFLRTYFERHAFQSMTTEDFLNYLEQHLFMENGIDYPEKEIKEWVYGEGLPETLPTPDSDRFEKVEAEVKRWKNGVIPENLDTTGWSTHEWLYFIRQIPERADKNALVELDEAFNFTESSNAEILCAWFQHAIRHEYEKAYPKIKSFLVETGRRKFLVPLYKAMLQTESGKQRAMSIYDEARPNYHSVSTGTLDDLMGFGTPADN